MYRSVLSPDIRQESAALKLEHDVHAMRQLISEHQTTYDRLASQLHAPGVSGDVGEAIRHASNTGSSEARIQVDRHENMRSDQFSQRESEYLPANPQQPSDEWLKSSRTGNEARNDQNREDADHAIASEEPGQSQKDPVSRPSVRFSEALDLGMPVPSTVSHPQSTYDARAPALQPAPAESRVLREQKLDDESEEHHAAQGSLRSRTIAEMRLDDTTADNEKVYPA
jgi:hypothetical protein